MAIDMGTPTGTPIYAADAGYVRRNDDEAGIELVGSSENVVMMRTFSKIHGLGGLRIGWGYGPAEIIGVLNRIRGPFNLSVVALDAAEAAMRDRDHVARCRAENARMRGWLAEALAEKGVPSSDVNVEVYKGVVLLSGFVKTQAEKDAAGKVAKNVKDVVSVRNEIAVHPATSMGTKLDDTVLVSKVKAALVDAKDGKSGQINVEARGGIVQLGGFVDNAQQKAQATKVARSVTGVKEVRNDLLVSTKPHATTGQDVDDSVLTNSVKAKLMDDSTTTAYAHNVLSLIHISEHTRPS